MHELSIAMSILDLAGEEVERQGGGRVVAIHLRLGPLAGVVKTALCSAFELAREASVQFQKLSLSYESMRALTNVAIAMSRKVFGPKMLDTAFRKPTRRG